MAGRQTADIVFCMDASGSMRSAFSGVRDNVIKLVESLKADLQWNWDVRFDFLAYSNYSDQQMRLQTLNCNGVDVIENLYSAEVDANGGNSAAKKFFTRDVEEFKHRINKIKVYGDESTCLALDVCADFPFRDAASCHRVVVLLTDESVNDGMNVSESNARLMDLAKKYQDKKIMLYMVTPNCDAYDTLSQIDKCEWTVDESRGLTDVDFSKLMAGIGKSVSVSQSALSGVSGVQPLFNESSWTSADYEYDDTVRVSTHSRSIF